MHRLDRALGILLLLRGGATVSAAELARRFEVSQRTVYRDIEALGALGVPVYAEMGRRGGFRLAPGYFLPPIMFSRGEAAALLVGVSMLRRLRATPFAPDLATAAQKVLAALPDAARGAIARAEGAIGFERTPADLLHPERDEGPPAPPGDPVAPRHESDVLGIFLRAIVEATSVELIYQAPGRGEPGAHLLAPRGLVWDRDRWYLVSAPAGRDEEARLWRADRVVALRQRDPLPGDAPAPGLERVLGRAWLGAAMARWAAEAPVVLSLTPGQAERLRGDWYYGHARFDPEHGGRVRMVFGEDDRAIVFALLRWLGPGARLVEPAAWRQAWRDQLALMLAEAEAP